MLPDFPAPALRAAIAIVGDADQPEALRRAALSSLRVRAFPSSLLVLPTANDDPTVVYDTRRLYLRHVEAIQEAHAAASKLLADAKAPLALRELAFETELFFFGFLAVAGGLAEVSSADPTLRPADGEAVRSPFGFATDVEAGPATAAAPCKCPSWVRSIGGVELVVRRRKLTPAVVPWPSYRLLLGHTVWVAEWVPATAVTLHGGCPDHGETGDATDRIVRSEHQLELWPTGGQR